MIKQKTVLILGAGASQPYGFPLGTQLVDHIWAELLTGKVAPPTDLAPSSQLDRGLLKRLAALGYPEDHTQKFATALRGTKPYSIDAFLEMRQEFLEVGKAAIADVLLRAEAYAATFEVHGRHDWYRYLFNTVLLRSNVAHFEKQVEQLRIVTFNFDRSLEHALYAGIWHGFGIETVDAQKLTNKLRIHHVHGRLGKPDWLYPNTGEGTGYGATGDALTKATKTAVQGMRIVHEPARENDLQKACEAIREASTVYFIGFGCDPRNLGKLEIPASIKSDTIVRCTLLGWSTAEQAPLSRYFGNRRMHLYPEADAIGFLREHAQELFE